MVFNTNPIEKHKNGKRDAVRIIDFIQFLPAKSRNPEIRLIRVSFMDPLGQKLLKLKHLLF